MAVTAADSNRSAFQQQQQQPAHPYYPVEVEIVGYIANEYTVPQLLSFFAAGCAVILGFTNYVVRSFRPRIPMSELLTVMWFVLSGSIHTFFEGYFAINHRSLANLQTLFAQMWKEYALADSRYLTSDPVVLVLESITALFWGPLCLYTAFMIVRGDYLRHPIQIIVSMGQLYGATLYYATSLFDHYSFQISYSRPEYYYFWGYYFSMNFFWIVIPAILIYNSTILTVKAMRIMDATTRGLEKATAAGVLNKKAA